MRKRTKLTEKAARIPDTRPARWEEAISQYLREVEPLHGETQRSQRFGMLMQELFGFDPGFIESYVSGIEKYLKVKQKDRLLRGKAALDPGYHSKKNLEEAERLEVDCYVTSRRGEEVGGDEVQGEAARVEVDCFASTVSVVSSPRLSGQGEVGIASIADGADGQKPDNAVQRMAAKLQTEEGKEVYRKRKEIIEPVFGQVKSNLGFVRFLLRGLQKVSGEWALVCLVHNIRRIYAYLKAKGMGSTEGLAKAYSC